MRRASLSLVCAILFISTIMVIDPDEGTDAVYTGPTVQVSTFYDVIEAGTSTEISVTCNDHNGDPLDLMRVRISSSVGSCTPAEAITGIYGSCSFAYNAPSSIPGPTSVTITAVMENGLLDVSSQKTLTVTYRISGEIIGPNLVQINSPDIVCGVHVTAGGLPLPGVSLNPTVMGSGTYVSHTTSTNSSGEGQLVVRPSTFAEGPISIIVQANKANYLSTSISKGITVSRTLDPLVITIVSDQDSCKRWGSRLITATVTRGGLPEPGISLSWRSDIGTMSPASTISISNGTSRSYFTANGYDGPATRSVAGIATINVTATNNAETAYDEISVDVLPEDVGLSPYIHSGRGFHPVLVGSEYETSYSYLAKGQYFPGEEMVLDAFAGCLPRSDLVHKVRSWFVLFRPSGAEVIRIDLGTGCTKDKYIFDFGPSPVYMIPVDPFVGNYTMLFEMTDPLSIHSYYTLEVPDRIRVMKYGADDWTFMYYFAGDNNCADWYDREIEYLEDVSLEGKFNVYVFFDRRETVVSNIDGVIEWSGTKRFDLDRGLAHAEDYPEPMNSGLGLTLFDFTAWAADCSPTGHYCLVLCDHGAAQEGICFQDIPSPRDYLGLQELNYSLSHFTSSKRTIDVLVYAACHMASLEVAAHVSEWTKYQVFSQKVMWADHCFENPRVLERLRDGFDWTSTKPLPIHVAADFLNGFNDVAGGTFYDCPATIVNSGSVDHLIGSLDDMCRIIYYNWDLLGDCMAEAFEDMWRTEGPYSNWMSLADIKGYIELVMAGLSEYIMTVPGRSAFEAAGDFIDAFDAAVEAFLPMDEYNGLNVYLPGSLGTLRYSDQFVDFKSEHDHWFKCLKSIYTGVGGTLPEDGWHPVGSGTPYVIDDDSDGIDDGYGFTIGSGGISAGQGWSAMVTISRSLTVGGGSFVEGSVSDIEVVDMGSVPTEGMEVRLSAPVNGTYSVVMRIIGPEGDVMQETVIGNVSLEGRSVQGSPPILELVGPTEPVEAGEVMAFKANVTDPDGDPLDIWWDMDLRNGLGLDGSGPSINWSYPVPGNTSVACFASDGSHLVVKEVHLSIFEPADNRDPVANMTWSRPRGLVVRFDASARSADPDGDRLQYRFNFGDGNMTGWTDDPVVEHDYPWSGIFTASLKVRDRRGGESDRSFHDMELFEIPNRAPVLAIPDEVEKIERGSSFSLWLNGSHDPDGDRLTVNITWGDGSSETYVFAGTIDRPMNHTYGRDGRYTIDVSVSDGTTNATSGELDVRVSDDTDDGNFDPWLVILIVIGVVTIIAILAFVALSAVLVLRSRSRSDEE